MDGTYVFPARTFRIGNIPAGTTAKQLEDVFHVEDRKFLQIKSLVPAVDNHDLNGEQTATVLYRPQIESNQRPRLLDDDITMDDHFHGLTPLYQPTGPISAELVFRYLLKKDITLLSCSTFQCHRHHRFGWTCVWIMGAFQVENVAPRLFAQGPAQCQGLNLWLQIHLAGQQS